MYTYLLINIFTVIVPIALSFESRIRYVRKWKYALAASFLTSLVFLPWDYLFTRSGIWGFNHAYLIGLEIGRLPVEEVLFFITVPFSCLFLYEVISLFTREDIFRQTIRPFIFTLIISCLIIAVAYWQRQYTFWNFLGLAVLLAVHLVIIRASYFGRFVVAYLVTLLPFLLVNGILTNGLSFVDSHPVVWYNNHENLALRLRGIPLEDFAYWALLYLMNITWYEFLQKKVKIG